MKQINIADGADGEMGAFCPEMMRRSGLDNFTICQALAAAMQPFAGLLRDGCGVGVYVDGEDGSIIGFTAPEKERGDDE